MKLYFIFRHSDLSIACHDSRLNCEFSLWQNMLLCMHHQVEILHFFREVKGWQQKWKRLHLWVCMMQTQLETCSLPPALDPLKILGGAAGRVMHDYRQTSSVHAWMEWSSNYSGCSSRQGERKEVWQLSTNFAMDWPTQIPTSDHQRKKASVRPTPPPMIYPLTKHNTGRRHYHQQLKQGGAVSLNRVCCTSSKCIKGSK